MAHKTIMIQEDVYELLNSLKGPNKSFNDVIKELILKNNDIMPFFGILKKNVADEIIQGIKESKIDETELKKQDKLKEAWNS